MSWIRNRDLPETLEFLGELTSICAARGGMYAHELAKLVSQKRYLEVINFQIPYSSIEREDAVYSRQIQGFFQKLEDLNLGVDKEAVALTGFANAELKCLDTNRRLQYHRRKPFLRSSGVDVVLHYAQQKIAGILGVLPSPDKLKFQFGPGANTNVSAARANPRAKLSAAFECSNKLVPAISALLEEVPSWVANNSTTSDESRWVVPVSVAHGKVVFVPKNAKTYRSIVVEPILNGFFQKGYGSYIRDCLLRSGIDLRDQTRNQDLACRASVDGSLATLDLSMASDCLSSELVWELLPFEWADCLDRLRSSTITLTPAQIVSLSESLGGQFVNDDGYLMLQKFSSMGNGYTFELESLIFYGLAYGAVRSLHLSQRDVSVYGDDIIIPKAAFSRLTEVLSYVGFDTNMSKSYSDGPFRESCGADYLNGFDIRPFYQKSLISDRTLYSMHNWFVRHGELALAEACKSAIRYGVIYGPDGYGDGHLIGSYQLRLSRKLRRAGWAGGFFDTFSLKPKFYKGLLPGDAVLPVYSVYTRSGEQSPTDPDVVRGSRGYAKISIYTLVDSIFHD